MHAAFLSLLRSSFSKGPPGVITTRCKTFRSRRLIDFLFRANFFRFFLFSSLCSCTCRSELVLRTVSFVGLVTLSQVNPFPGYCYTQLPLTLSVGGQVGKRWLEIWVRRFGFGQVINGT